MLDSKVAISRAQVSILQHEGKEDCIAMLECKAQQKSLPTSFGKSRKGDDGIDLLVNQRNEAFRC